MPDIQKLYETYETEGDNAVIILGVAAPGLGQEKDEAGRRLRREYLAAIRGS